MASSRPTVLRFFAILICLSLYTATSHGQIFGGFGKPARRAGKDKAAELKEAREAMAKGIELKLEEEKLSFEFPMREEADKLSEEIVPSTRSSSRGGNDNSYFIRKESEHVQFVISTGVGNWGINNQKMHLIQLSESTNQTNRIEIKLDVETDDLKLLSMNPDEHKINILRQTDSELTFVAIDGDNFDFFSGNSIGSLAAKPNFRSAFAKLREAGFGVPEVASHDSITDLVDKVLNFSEEDRKEFEEAFPNLTSLKFKLRKEAAQELAKQLDDHHVAVSAMLLSDDLPLEMRARIVEAVTASKDEQTRFKIRTVTAKKLNKDPAVLTQLLKRQKKTESSAESISKTVSQLEKVTGESFGDNVNAWSKWVEKNVAASPAEKSEKSKDKSDPKAAAKKRSSPVKKRTEKSGFGQVREPLRDLLKLKRDDSGAIAIDRGHWSQMFDGKSPNVMMKEAKEAFLDSGLPKSWLKMGGGYDTAAVGFEQILFERIAEGVTVRSQNRNAYRERETSSKKTLNRSTEQTDFNMALKVHAETNRWDNVRHKRAFFRFTLEDNTEDLFYFISEEPDQGFSIFVFWKNGKTIFSVHSDKDGKTSLHHVADGKRTSLTSDSIEQLSKDNAAFVKETIVPLLNSIGISAENAF